MRHFLPPDRAFHPIIHPSALALSFAVKGDTAAQLAPGDHDLSFSSDGLKCTHILHLSLSAENGSALSLRIVEPVDERMTRRCGGWTFRPSRP